MNHLILQADARRIPLADQSVHCVVTSPPYFGLRDYGTGTWQGGDSSCSHKASNERMDHSNGAWLETRGEQAGNKARSTPMREQCKRCGAVRIDRQIGLEPTPDEFVAAMVVVFREVRRVLRNDGTCWLNIGDSYANDAKGPRGNAQSTLTGSTSYQVQASPPGLQKAWRSCAGLKKKDLMLIPARVALALQADGWYVRQECIWAKRNCMPESVRDRPSRSHEVVYLLTKKPRYFYDDIATRTPQKTLGKRHEGKSGYRTGHPSKGGIASRALNPLGAAERSVWSLSSRPFKGAHFATMPPELAEKCVRLGTSEWGCCPACGRPWRRVVQRLRIASRPDLQSKYQGVTDRTNHDRGRHVTEVVPVCWESSCTCLEPTPVPCVVFDPFGGALTTAVVADSLGRDSVSLDLSRNYLLMGRERLERPHKVTQRPTPSQRSTSLLF